MEPPLDLCSCRQAAPSFFFPRFQVVYAFEFCSGYQWWHYYEVWNKCCPICALCPIMVSSKASPLARDGRAVLPPRELEPHPSLQHNNNKSKFRSILSLLLRNNTCINLKPMFIQQSSRFDVHWMSWNVIRSWQENKFNLEESLLRSLDWLLDLETTILLNEKHE